MNLVILGAGGQGRETLEIAKAIIKDGKTSYNFKIDKVIGFLDEKHVSSNDPLSGFAEKIIGTTEDLEKLDAYYTIAIGSGAKRFEVFQKLSHVSQKPAILLHPYAVVGERVFLGDGVTVAGGTSITTNVKIGKHSIVNVNSSISHDCNIGDFTTISPGVNVSGNVKIGSFVTLGTGCVILPNISIGDNAVVGAGAVVTKEVLPNTVVVGNPARQIEN